MSHVADFLKRAAKSMGFRRDAYVEKNMPNVTSNLLVVPFYGDLRSTMIFSMFLMRSFRDLWPEKYIIVASWPGYESLFPYVDEYWSLEDEGVAKLLSVGAGNFSNSTDLSMEITRKLIEHFSGVIRHSEIKKYYFNGFQKSYWDELKEIKRFFPEIVSSSMMEDSFKNQISSKTGDKVVIYPAKRVNAWNRDKTQPLKVSKEFWLYLAERMLDEGITPLVYQNMFTYDLSGDLVDRCLYMVPSKINGAICAMRHIGCVLDVFSGVSRLAIAARTPFLCVDERLRYMNHKEYEIDDLSCDGVPKKYMFSFGGLPTVGGPDEWKVNLVDGIMAKLREFLPIDHSKLPPTKESYESVSYDVVRERKSKRMGIHFINSSKLK